MIGETEGLEDADPEETWVTKKVDGEIVIGMRHKLEVDGTLEGLEADTLKRNET